MLAEAIDIGLKPVLEGEAEGLLETARNRGVLIVASVHDFEGTPPRNEMVRTLTEAGKYADVAKLAVTAESRADTLALLSVTEQLSSHGDPVATMAMGEVGSHTRAVAPVYGSNWVRARGSPGSDCARAVRPRDTHAVSR